MKVFYCIYKKVLNFVIKYRLISICLVIFGQNSLEMFIWMPKEQLYVLVYLVTVSHSMMAGYMDKALKYTEKALAQIDKLKAQENKPILSVFQIILLEHIVMCRLVMGNKTMAIKVNIKMLLRNIILKKYNFSFEGNCFGPRCLSNITKSMFNKTTLSPITLLTWAVCNVH